MTLIRLNKIQKQTLEAFFSSLIKRNIRETNKNLETLKQVLSQRESMKFSVSQRESRAGIYTALSGMLIAVTSKDKRAFINNIDFSDKKQLKQFRKDFKERLKTRKELTTDYDLGFFTVWFRFMNFLLNGKL